MESSLQATKPENNVFQREFTELKHLKISIEIISKTSLARGSREPRGQSDQTKTSLKRLDKKGEGSQRPFISSLGSHEVISENEPGKTNV